MKEVDDRFEERHAVKSKRKFTEGWQLRPGGEPGRPVSENKIGWMEPSAPDCKVRGALFRATGTPEL